MKMTPEQKAFFEYGELFQLWKDARRCVFWHEESHDDIRREIVQRSGRSGPSVGRGCRWNEESARLAVI